MKEKLKEMASNRYVQIGAAAVGGICAYKLVKKWKATYDIMHLVMKTSEKYAIDPEAVVTPFVGLIDMSSNVVYDLHKNTIVGQLME